MKNFNFFWGNLNDVIIRVSEKLTPEEEGVFKALYPKALIIVENDIEVINEVKIIELNNNSKETYQSKQSNNPIINYIIAA